MPWNSRVRTIVRREYIQRVRSRWFLFSTLVVPLLFVALSVLPVLLASSLGQARRSVVLVDATSDEIGRALEDRLRGANVRSERVALRVGEDLDLEGFRAWIRGRQESAPEAGRGADPKGTENGGAEYAESAWLYLGPSTLESGEALLVEARELDSVTRSQLGVALEETVRAARLAGEGVGEAAIEEALRPTSIDRKPLRAEDGPSGFRLALGFVFALVLYMMFMIYGQMIARGVLEEKTSDIVEILISSARPWELMLGKIVGIGAVGLTQVGIWATVLLGVSAMGLGSLQPALVELGVDPAAISVPWSLIGWSLVYFVIGYLLFSAVFAAAGAMVTTEQDVQQALWPVMIPVVLPMMLMPIAMEAPDAPLVAGLSLLPFFSPIWMPVRIAVGGVPLWQSIVAVTLLVLTTLLLAWMAGKIFRMGILMKGKRPNLPEIARWLRHG
jgi:ABC-2 type transport system permease protein